MKKLFVSLTLAIVALTARAHDHIEVARSADNPAQLAIAGIANQIATYFPLGEAPSSYLYAFPGGVFACELTFSAFDNSAPPPNGAFVRIEALSVSGPAGSSFSFWEVGAANPSWTKPAGWTASGGDQPSFAVSEDGTGYGHIHGRVFTADRPGVYQVTFRAVDATGHYAASAPLVVQFTALQTPQLSISKASLSIKLTFQSRANLSYDVQSSTTLKVNDWITIGDPLDGSGGMLEFTDPIAARTRVFYRLVEYQ